MHYPFSAVAGQSAFKLALILAAISPSIGGVLVSGPRGAAKSTLARSLADILPSQQTEGASPFITLPLGASEEMLVGTLDLQKVLSNAEVSFNPGLLAKADNGVLYVDEVNLLSDTLVDLLLDVAASGVNRIERDGISHSHSSQFILLGTMNPDEGELRPQLQDRFGLAVELSNHYSLDERMDIVLLREDFDRDPTVFCQSYSDEQERLQQSIVEARQRLAQVECDTQQRRHIAERCSAANVDGLRADIVWCRAAQAHAAWCGRSRVTIDDLNTVEELVLSHRRRQPPQAPQQPPQSPPTPPPFSRPPPKSDQSSNDAPSNADQSSADQNSDRGEESKEQSSGDWGSMSSQQQNTAASEEVNPAQYLPRDDSGSHVDETFSARLAGPAAGSAKPTKRWSRKPNWFATLVKNSGQWPPKQLSFLRQKSAQPSLHLVLLDTSASTLKNSLFARAKAAVLSIADRAYLNREQLMLLGFGNGEVQTLLPRTRAPKALRQLLDTIPAAGGTPLREVLQQAREYRAQLFRQFPQLQLRTYLITDGRTTTAVDQLQAIDDCVLVDIESSAVKRGKGPALAAALGAEYLPLPA